MGLTSIQASWGYGIPMATRPASHLHWPNVATVPWARPQFSYQGSEAPKNRHKTIQRRHLTSQDLLHEFLVKTPQSAEVCVLFVLISDFHFSQVVSFLQIFHGLFLRSKTCQNVQNCNNHSGKKTQLNASMH